MDNEAMDSFDEIRGKSDLAAAFRKISVELYNKEHNPAKALEAINQACALDPENSRYLYDRDRILENVGADPLVRLSMLEEKKELIDERDDLSLNYISVLSRNGREEEALDRLMGRNFHLDEELQPKIIAVYKELLFAFALKEIKEGNKERAAVLCELTFTYPDCLGVNKGKTLPDNKGWYLIGEIKKDEGKDEEAEEAYKKAAEGSPEPELLKSVSDYPSDSLYWIGLAKARLGQQKEALDIMRKLMDFGSANMKEETFGEDKEEELLYETYRDELVTKNNEYCRMLISLGVKGLGEVNR